MTETKEFDFVLSDKILDKYIESQVDNLWREKLIGLLCAPLLFFRFPINIQSERLDVTQTQAWSRLGEPLSKARLRERFRQHMNSMFSAIADNIRFDKTGQVNLTESCAGGKKIFVTPFLLNYFTSGNDREKEFWLNWHRRIVMELVNWLDYKHDGAASFSWGKMIFNEYNNIVIIPAELSASV